MKHIIYLHGFLSSPKSVKAQLTFDYVSKHHPDVTLHIPTLPGSPKDAVSVIERLIKHLVSNQDTDENELRFIGSSMGGFLSTFCVETYGGKAVLINPAVQPFNLLNNYFGQHKNPYTGEFFSVDKTSVEQLRKLDKKIKVNNHNYLIYLQTADETLDYKLALEKYGKDRCIVEHGGNHSFVGLDNHLCSILEFLLS
jgi:predicted esterase YcpF (UPF0227 family)